MKGGRNGTAYYKNGQERSSRILWSTTSEALVLKQFTLENSVLSPERIKAAVRQEMHICVPYKV